MTDEVIGVGLVVSAQESANMMQQRALTARSHAQTV